MRSAHGEVLVVARTEDGSIRIESPWYKEVVASEFFLRGNDGPYIHRAEDLVTFRFTNGSGTYRIVPSPDLPADVLRMQLVECSYE